MHCVYTDILFITAYLLCTCKQKCETFRIYIDRFSKSKIGLDLLGLMENIMHDVNIPSDYKRDMGELTPLLFSFGTVQVNTQAPVVTASR